MNQRLVAIALAGVLLVSVAGAGALATDATSSSDVFAQQDGTPNGSDDGTTPESNGTAPDDGPSDDEPTEDDGPSDDGSDDGSPEENETLPPEDGDDAPDDGSADEQNASQPDGENATDASDQNATDPDDQNATDPNGENATDPDGQNATDGADNATEPSDENVTEPSEENATEPPDDETAPDSDDGPTPPAEDDAEPPADGEAEQPTDDASTDDGATDDGTDGAATISVTGVGEAAAEPDRAIVYLVATGTGDSPAAAADALAANASSLRDALEASNVTDDVRSTDYQLYETQERMPMPETASNTTDAWTARHTFEVGVVDPNATGDVIDLAVENGASEVQGIGFALSNETERAVRAMAIDRAVDDANDQATVVASSTDLDRGQIRSVRVDTGSAGPVFVETADASTEVDVGDVTVTAHVEIVYGASTANGNSAGG